MNTLEAAIHAATKVHYLDRFCFFVHDETHWNTVCVKLHIQLNR